MRSMTEAQLKNLKMGSVARPFWTFVHFGADCHEWIGAHNRAGYGMRRHGLRTTLAHRDAWELHHGAIPDGMSVLHRCDNPPCVRLDHLFLGTALDNVRDCMSKGRAHWQSVTHCPSGHPYDEKNTRREMKRGYVIRKCRACVREYMRTYKKKGRTDASRQREQAPQG